MNKNLLGAVAGFLFNYSVALFEKKVENEEIVSYFGKILNIRIEMDPNEENKRLLLQAGANVVFKYQKLKG